MTGRRSGRRSRASAAPASMPPGARSSPRSGSAGSTTSASRRTAPTARRAARRRSASPRSRRCSRSSPRSRGNRDRRRGASSTSSNGGPPTSGRTRATGVNLLTYHRAKGLEWDAVFLPMLEEGSLPIRQALDDDEALAEERRLLYVGITRARVHLALSWAERRETRGREGRRQQSRFLLDLRPRTAGAASVGSATSAGRPSRRRARGRATTGTRCSPRSASGGRRPPGTRACRPT